ncbi:MAG: uncharacterized protein KVP18_003945 [Porospora cf. gigantea A]|nr:MAG: hypothetical protein KVP18_003945 [Porospora cf. gigantea A]
METRLSNIAAHTWLCGLGSGLYLNLATSSVDAVVCIGGRLDTALMSSQLGSVYLDKFGEEDPHVSRGRLLKLSHCRWAGLNQMWMAGGLRWGTRPWPESDGIEWTADLFQ